MSPNPAAVEMLGNKYTQYIKLLQARADLDSRIMIVATDISQITSAALINAPVGGIEEPKVVEPTKPVEEKVVEPATPQPQVQEKEEKAPEPATEKVAEPTTTVPKEEPKGDRKPIEYDDIQAMVQECVTKGKIDDVRKVAAMGAYSSLSDEDKMLMEDKLKEVLGNG